MKSRTSRTAIWMATLLFGSTTLVYAGGHEKMTIGQVTDNAGVRYTGTLS